MQAILQKLLSRGHVLVFVLLELICSFLIVNYNNEHNKIFFSSVNRWIGEVNSGIETMSGYVSIQDELERIQAENAALKAQLDGAYYHNTLKIDSTFKDSIDLMYTYIPARVINRSLSGTKHTITIDKGSNQGVEAHMGVIDEDGIVGITRKVGSRFTSIMSVLHRDAKISAAIKNRDHHGSLIWDGANTQYMTLTAIPRHAICELGDTIITSGYSHIFPEGIIIGTVEEKDRPAGDNFYTIKVKVSNNYSNLRSVYVVNNLMKSEITELEAALQDE